MGRRVVCGSRVTEIITAEIIVTMLLVLVSFGIIAVAVVHIARGIRGHASRTGRR